MAVREHTDPSTLKTLMEQNRPKGFACVSCAWTKPAEAKLFEFCENGAKATLWETTPLRCTPDFFAEHTVTELRSWKDLDLEQQGRLTHPLRYDPATDKYVPCSWDEAFAAIGARAAHARRRKSVDLLRVGPRQPRDVLLLRAAGAAVRLQQPARQFEHVPRDDVGGAARR